MEPDFFFPEYWPVEKVAGLDEALEEAIEEALEEFEGGAEFPPGGLGDILAYNEDGEVEVLPAGTKGQRLIADPGEPLGLKWGAAPGSEEEEEEPESPTEEEEKELEELEKWLVIHAAHVNQEENNNAKLEFFYNPPANCDLLVVTLVCAEASFTGVHKTITLGGKAPDTKIMNALEFEQIYTYIWKKPAEGTIVITNEGAARKDYVVLPISYKNQGKKELESNTNQSFGHKDKEVLEASVEYNGGTLPHIRLFSVSRRNQITEPKPASCISGSGVLIADISVKDFNQCYRVEFRVKFCNPGTNKMVIKWPEKLKNEFTQRGFDLSVREKPV